VCRSALTLLLLIPGMIACPRQGQLSSLLVAGSSTVLPYSQKLAEEFSRRNPMIHVLCDSGGSLAGLIAVKRGAIGVAAMSHELKSRQDEEGVRVSSSPGTASAWWCTRPIPSGTSPATRSVRSLRDGSRGGRK